MTPAEERAKKIKLEHAKQKARVAMLPVLDKALERLEEDALEDIVDDLLIEAGFEPMPGDPEATAEQMDTWYDLQKEVIEEVVQFWFAGKVSPVWAVVSHDPEVGVEVEFFSQRPTTADGDPSNWPKWFRVYEGNIDGGDSICTDSRGKDFG